ncbi:MAG TPA: DUF481 domain-containing protein [Gemmatimonadaceae bacterium]
MRRLACLLGVIWLGAAFPPAAAAQKTDVVTLANGDRITGEVKGLDRGRLEFSTDDAGVLYLEWDKLVSVVAPTRRVEVVTRDGRRFLGALAAAGPRLITIVGADGAVALGMPDVTIIRPIGTSFWRKLDGSLDAGFNYTRSSGVAQLNVNSDTVYPMFASQVRLAASMTVTAKDDDEGSDDRGTVEMSYLHFPWREWFIMGAGRFETNESLGLRLRSQAGVATGPRLINSNRAQLSIGGGIAVNDERGVDVEPARNVEGILLFTTSFFTYDRPKTNLDLTVQYYPSLSNIGRHRLQLDAGARYELLKDFFVALSFYNSFDSRPPNPAADTNDVGIVVSIGWSY